MIFIVLVSKFFSSFFQQDALQFKTEMAPAQLNNFHVSSFEQFDKNLFITKSSDLSSVAV